jgi:hypothetical protein
MGSRTTVETTSLLHRHACARHDVAGLVALHGAEADAEAHGRVRAVDRAVTQTPPPGAVKPGLVLAYFGQFGVNEALMKEGLAAALAKGADRADLYFEHKVSTYLTLEDGEGRPCHPRVPLFATRAM